MEIPNQIPPPSSIPEEPPTKSRKNIKIIALIIVFFLLASIAIFVFIKNQPNSTIKTDQMLNEQEQKIKIATAECEKIISETSKNRCYSSLAHQLKDLSICNVIKNNQREKDVCVGGIAVLQKDAEICQQITNQDIKQECDAYFNAIPVKNRDAKRISDIHIIQVALEKYFDQIGGGYPPTLNSLLTTGLLDAIPVPPEGSGQASYSYASVVSSLQSSPCRTINGVVLGTGYHLGAVLENASNSALLDDRDSIIASAMCGASAADFMGNSTDCASTIGTDRCYDVTQ